MVLEGHIICWELFTIQHPPVQNRIGDAAPYAGFTKVNSLALTEMIAKEEISVCHRMAYNVYRRSRALAHLPGPTYPWLLGDMALLQRKDPHRAATELVETYGPLLKVRLMCFHVSFKLP